jgi:hypothetical protein
MHFPRSRPSWSLAAAKCVCLCVSTATVILAGTCAIVGEVIGPPRCGALMIGVVDQWLWARGTRTGAVWVPSAENSRDGRNRR